MDKIMAAGRMLKKEISDSRKLGELKSDRARVLWFMMLPHLDVVGRMEANVRRIKGQITTMLPYSEKAIQTCLEQLHDVGLIILYTESGEQFLEFTKFGEFQTLNPDREAESKIPAPNPENSRAIQSTPLNISEVNVTQDKSKYSENSKELELARLLLKLILERKKDYKQPNLQAWAKSIDLMIRKDDRKPDAIENVIHWCQQDDFWQNNILSTSKLRIQFDKLELRMQKDGFKRRQSPGTSRDDTGSKPFIR